MRTKVEAIKNEKDFDNAFSMGRRHSEKCIKALAAKNNLGRPRLAIIVKKKFGKATERNKIRRRIKEAFKRETEKLGEGRGLDIVIFPDITAKNASFLEIEQAIARIFNKQDLNNP